MARTLPRTTDQWLKEILPAWKDARETKSFGPPHGHEAYRRRPLPSGSRDLPEVPGRKLTGKEADRVTKGPWQLRRQRRHAGLEEKPQLAFALCYVAAHLVLDLVDEQTAGEVMGYCEEQLPG